MEAIIVEQNSSIHTFTLRAVKSENIFSNTFYHLVIALILDRIQKPYNFTDSEIIDLLFLIDKTLDTGDF
jgi:hypothetical protein